MCPLRKGSAQEDFEGILVPSEAFVFGEVIPWSRGATSAVGRHDEALRALQKALRLNPTDIFAHLSLAGVYVELGREEEARAAAKEVLRLNPKFSLEHLAKTLPYKDQAFVDRRIELLRKAGLK